MQPFRWSATLAPRSGPCRWVVLGLLAILSTPGCESARVGAPSVSDPPVVQVISPRVRDIVRVVEQPSFVESYERTSIYPKLTGYIEKWNVDIGDRVKKGQTLATLFVPETREDWETKKRTVKLDKGRVDLALKAVEVAEANVETAEAQLEEARELVAKFKSDVEGWDVQVKRLRRELDRDVVDAQIVLESKNQFQMSTAAWKAAQAAVAKAKAQLVSSRASLAQALVDVNVARDRVGVAESDAKRLEAWVGYLTLPAPFDGVISARNANTWDFVLPRMGDPSADSRAPHLSPGGQAAPIYVVDRIDVVRIFVDIPESDANFVKEGSKTSVFVKAFRDQWIPAAVTRTSWALNVKSRTLRAEIDLSNTDNPELYRDIGQHLIAKIPANNGIQILPGMYAIGKVIIDRPKVRALPVSALVLSGEKAFYWAHRDGRATKVQVQTGVSDGQWIEVNNRQLPPTPTGEDPWAPIDGSEQVILGDLSLLTEGASVRVDQTAASE